MSSRGSPHDSPSLQYLPPSPFGRMSTTAASGVLTILLVYYLLQYLDHTNLPISELLWNSLVYITPAQLVARLDSTFAEAMVDGTTNVCTQSQGHASKSNALRRLLGLDGSGLWTTVQRTRTLSNLSSVFKAVAPTPRRALPGLGNWDNSCYQNSVLQGLASLESLHDFLDDAAPSDAPQPTKTALRELIAKLNDPGNRGKTLWTPAELKSMSSWQQQDAQEYFSKLSDGLEKDVAKAAEAKLGRPGLEVLVNARQDLTHSSSVGDHTTPQNNGANSTRQSSVDQLPEEMKSLIVQNPLEGLLAQRVGCQRCGYVEGLSLVPFNCLTVPLGRHWMYDVRTCLDEYTALEPINGVECAKCTLLCAEQQMEQMLAQLRRRLGEPFIVSEDTSKALLESLQERLSRIRRALEDADFSDQTLKKCQIPAKNRVSTTKSRQAVIARAPRCLVIHINRSNFDELTGLQSKNSGSVRFPQQLDLAPWCLGQGPGPDDGEKSIENWNVDPCESMLSGSDNLESLHFGKTYELHAVVTHYGRHENGHYICYRKAPYDINLYQKEMHENNDSWWRLSDQDVDEIGEEMLLAQGGVFMLFYEQVATLASLKEHPRDEPTAHKGVETTDKTQLVDHVGRPVGSLKLAMETSMQAHAAEHATITVYPTPPMSPLISDAKSKDMTIPAGDLIEPAATPKDSDIVDPPASATSQGAKLTFPEVKVLHANPATQQPITAHIIFPKPNNPPPEPTEQPDPPTTPKESQPVSPASMRTAAPRSGRGSVGRTAGKAMGSVAGFVQAN